MTPRVLSLAAAAALAAALVIAPAATPFSTAPLIPAASAACPDAEVVFARGRQEPPGVGAVGDALVNSLRSKVAMSVGVYGVNYPADLSAAIGANDIRAHVQSMAGSCPNTRMVLGGYSLGATAADLVTRGNCRRVWISTSQRSRCSVTPPTDSARPPPLTVGRSTSARTATPSVGEARIGRRICSPHTSAPDWWIRPPASSPAGSSRGSDQRLLLDAVEARAMTGTVRGETPVHCSGISAALRVASMQRVGAGWRPAFQKRFTASGIAPLTTDKLTNAVSSASGTPRSSPRQWRYRSFTESTSPQAAPGRPSGSSDPRGWNVNTDISNPLAMRSWKPPGGYALGHGGGQVSIGDIRPTAVQQWIADLSRGSDGMRPVGASVLQRTHYVLSSILADAVRDSVRPMANDLNV